VASALARSADKEVAVTITTRTEPVAGNGDTAPVETPFLEVYETPSAYEELVQESYAAPETPFVSEYLVGDEVVSESPSAFRELLEELYDEEFDEALTELVEEADAHAQLLGAGELDGDPARVERALEHWIAPLRIEAETLLQEMADSLEATDPQLMGEAELDEFLDRFEPHDSSGGPVFEDFLKKIWKKAKKAVKGAVNLAKKGIKAVGKILPIGVILNKIKALVRPLLQRVLKIALNKLPPALRPAAAALAKRFLGTREVEALEADELTDAAEAPASADLRSLQAEFDAQTVALMLTPTEPEQEALLAEASVQAERLDDTSLAELDEARAAFVNRLMELEDGEDPTPAVEQFLPAILPALRIGIKLIGRPKVVRFLAKFLGRLIAPYVGKRLTPPLSQAIVDAGLRLMTLEAGEEEADADPRLAGEAFAALVEETVGRVAELDEDELDEEAIVEEVAMEGFHSAVGRHFPASVLRGGRGSRSGGIWMAMPRRRRMRYRKYSRIFDAKISPGSAAAVRTRGGQTLATFLKDRLGQTGPVQARVHLYRAVPGTRLGAIARAEGAVRGLGPSAVGTTTEILPLTREAAGALLGEAELGEDVSEAYLDEAAPPAVGQTFYFLEVAGGRPTSTSTAPVAPAARPRMSTTTALIDLRSGKLVLAIFLAEAQAQAIAAGLRRKVPIGSTLSAMAPAYIGAVRTLASAAGRRRIRIVGEVAETEPEYGQPAREELFGFKGLPSPGTLVGKVLAKWTRRAIARELGRQRETFIAATEAPTDGVTMLVTLAGPPGLATIGQVLRGRLGAGLRGLRTLPGLLKAQPAAKLEIVAGYRRA
jgi:hypothetical protein